LEVFVGKWSKPRSSEVPELIPTVDHWESVSHWIPKGFNHSTLLNNLAFITWNGDFPKLPKVEVNPDRWFSGTCVNRLSSIRSSRGLWEKVVLVWKVLKPVVNLAHSLAGTHEAWISALLQFNV
jgi:hypothetical protein